MNDIVFVWTRQFTEQKLHARLARVFSVDFDAPCRDPEMVLACMYIDPCRDGTIAVLKWYDGIEDALERCYRSPLDYPRSDFLALKKHILFWTPITDLFEQMGRPADLLPRNVLEACDVGMMSLRLLILAAKKEAQSDSPQEL